MDLLTLVAQAAQQATSDTTTLIVSAVSAIIAGFGVKVFDWFINRGGVQVDEAEQIRSELREEANRLTRRLNEVIEELDHWKERYYELLGKHEQSRLEVELQRLKLTEYEQEPHER